jgi:NAD+ kinase
MHPSRPEALEAAARFVTGMHKHNITCLIDALGLELLAPHVPAGSLKDIVEARDVELDVVFGGDGNILRAAEWAVPREVPVLGVNLGHVGFLAELESSEVGELIRRVVDKDYHVEERETIEIRVRNGSALWESFAVNEVSIEKLARERMLEVLVRVDGKALSRWATDGVLVSTPTGSTAYAFSAHGPVVWPDVQALLLVPLSAHALFARPLVISPDSVVEIEIVDGAPDGVVWCDGRRSFEITQGMAIKVTRGTHKLHLARTGEQPFVTRLVRKFELPVAGWRGGRKC